MNFRRSDLDLVVTVCDSAAEECPVWLGKGKRVHHSFVDPFNARGTDEEILNAYRQVRDQIALEIPKLLEKYSIPGRTRDSSQYPSTIDRQPLSHAVDLPGDGGGRRPGVPFSRGGRSPSMPAFRSERRTSQSPSA